MIRMIRGVFGLPVNGVVKAMDKNSGPFEAGEEQEARLIRLGLAVRVEVSEPAPEEVVGAEAPIGFDETPPEPEDADGTPEYSVKMKAPELREIGAMYGLTFKVGMTKEAMVAALDKYFAETAVEEDGEPAPVFDAAEAVQ